MVIKIVKIYLGLSLVLWAVWGHFQGGSLCLVSSVCWSLQCLISALTQGGGGGHCFFFVVFFFFVFCLVLFCFVFRLTCSVEMWGGRDAANK